MSNELTRNPALRVVATYRRAIAASLERVWENVLDWEHLPWLHSLSFGGIECHDAGPWGWRAVVRYPGSETVSNLELLTQMDEGRYVTRVLDGPGAGGEIWTSLERAKEGVTDIVVEFCAELPSDADAKSIGQGYVALYERLWDEDESMMQRRQAELDRRARQTANDCETSPVELGSVEEVRAKLPLSIEAFGARMRLVVVDGEWVLHSLTCPHSLGPLDESEIVGGEIQCPWHGYRFDVISGRSCDGKKLRLACPATLELDEDRVRLVLRNAGEFGAHPQ